MNKKIIKEVNELTFNNYNEIEKEISKKNIEEIEKEYINENLEQKYIECLYKLIDSNLKINTFQKSTNSFKNKSYSLIKSMNKNYFSENQQWKNFILSELYIPIYLINKYHNLEWIYFNQLFNWNKDSTAPAQGTDAIFLMNNNNLLISEIKSSISNKSINNNLNSAINEIKQINNDNFESLKEKIISRIDNEKIKIIDSIKIENIHYNISFFNINCEHKSLELSKFPENNPLSIFELRIKDDRKNNK